ncbi:MAG: hypothetical protein K5905_01550 [Roseibium sp.]|uniref:hypothetical protein n=1 Tax=Roseibium sp. TaxID=1936156 RepID=UPI00260DD455|nr:hypothetical protein [Roseibium sp.]MCV0424135.1 hypothetical protein [Roseibium sp.]
MGATALKAIEANFEEPPLCAETIRRLTDAGIAFMAELTTPLGCENVHFGPEDLNRLLEDKTGFAAGYFGVTRQQYLDWIATGGNPRCSSETRSGKPCRKPAGGRYQIGIDEWLASDGGLCRSHETRVLNRIRKSR